MTGGPKQPPWQIRVGRKANVLAEFNVPAHKMGINDLRAFLRALVVRYRTDTPEEMVDYYVNRRAGHPIRLPFAEVIQAHDLEKCLVGYLCGNWECYASAMQEIDTQQAQALKSILRTPHGNF